MEVNRMPVDLAHFNHAGVVFSAEERACLQGGLDLYRFKEGFKSMIFWGVIHGINAKYYLAQGLTSEPLGERVTVYSNDCTQWARLPTVSSAVLQKARHVRGRFTGDPSYQQSYTIYPDSAEGSATPDGAPQGRPHNTKLKEELRLAATVQLINRDVGVVPRGYLVRGPKGDVTINPGWQGLGVSDATNRRNYYHPRMEKNDRPTDRESPRNVPGIDFLDVIDEGRSVSWWLVRTHRGSALVTLRSILWEGYTFFIVPNTRTFGALYSGTGEMNLDVVHMMPRHEADDDDDKE